MKIAVVCEPAHFMHPDKAMHPDNTKIIFDVLRGVGFDPKKDVTWVSLCRPIPKQDMKSNSRTSVWIEKFLPDVRAKLQGAEVVMTLGKWALQAVAGKGVSISKTRGVPQVLEKFTLLPTLTPGQAKHDPSVLNKLRVDAARLRQLVEDGGRLVDRPFGDYKWFFDTHHLRKLKAMAGDFEGINEAGRSALDVYDPATVPWTFQVTWKPGMAAVIPTHRDLWQRLRGDLVGFDEAQAHLKHVLNDPDVAKVFHNAPFDMHFGANSGYPIRGVIDDTQVMSWYADENAREYNLNACTAVHVPTMAGFNDAWEAKIADKGRMQDVPTDVLLNYAGGDTDACWQLRAALHAKLSRDPGHYDVYRRIKMPSLLSFVRTVEEGVFIDQKRLAEIAIEFDATYRTLHDEFVAHKVPAAVKRKHLREAEEKIRSAKRRDWTSHVEAHRAAMEGLDDKGRARKEALIAQAQAKLDGLDEMSFAVDSKEVLKLSRPDFVRDIFFSKEGFDLDPKQYTESTEDLDDEDLRLASTSVKHLKLYLSELPTQHPCRDTIVAATKLSTVGKMISTYTGRPEDAELREKGIWQHLKPWGRYHSNYPLTATNTSRPASRAPNDQNIPTRTAEAKTLKSAWVSPDEDEWVLLAADLSQIELRLAAWESGDRVMIQAYREGRDIHANTASGLVNLTYAEFMAKSKEWRKGPRTNAKPVNFGFIYGQHAPSFRDFAEQQYDVVLTIEQAREFRTKFFRTYPDLEAWHQSRWTEACRQGFVTSLHGQIRHLPELKGADWSDFNSLDTRQRDALRQAVNAPIQGFGSALNEAGKARLNAQGLEWLRVNRSIHDAIYAYCRRDRVADGIQAMVHAMQTVPLTDWFGIEMPIPLISEADVGFRGDKMIELSEPPAAGEGPEWFEPMRDRLAEARLGAKPSFWNDGIDRDLVRALNVLPARSVHSYVA